MSAFGHGRLPGQTGVRGTGYTFGGDAPALLEIVGAFGSGQAARAFPSFVQGLNGCSYPAEVGGQAVVSRLAPLSAAKVGAASATYTSSLGAAYSAVVVAVEKGEAIALIIYIDRGTPNDVAAMNVASAAAARL